MLARASTLDKEPMIEWLANLLGDILTPAVRVFRRNRYIDRELCGPATLNKEWLEIIPIKPLNVERSHQDIVLYPDPPIQMVFDKNLIPANGLPATLEAELLGTNEVTYQPSPGLSERMTGDLRITSRSLSFKGLPKDVTYKKVRIRSNVDYPVKKILWRCYNWAEVHK